MHIVSQEDKKIYVGELTLTLALKKTLPIAYFQKYQMRQIKSIKCVQQNKSNVSIYIELNAHNSKI